MLSLCDLRAFAGCSKEHHAKAQRPQRRCRRDAEEIGKSAEEEFGHEWGHRFLTWRIVIRRPLRGPRKFVGVPSPGALANPRDPGLCWATPLGSCGSSANAALPQDTPQQRLVRRLFVLRLLRQVRHRSQHTIAGNRKSNTTTHGNNYTEKVPLGIDEDAGAGPRTLRRIHL